MLSLTATIPAFYAELLFASPSPLADAVYGFAALMVFLHEIPAWLYAVLRPELFRTLPQGGKARLGRRLIVVGLITGLVAAALLPPSLNSTLALTLRSATSLMTLLYLLWSLQHLLSRGSLPVLLSLAVTVLFLCGVGFWWLEPSVNDLSEGLWLAFTTAATVGYGDLVPTTAASKIFSVFVVLLGYGVLSLVTAAIASTWVETSERELERQMITDLHQEITALRAELETARLTHQTWIQQPPPQGEATSPAISPSPLPAATTLRRSRGRAPGSGRPAG